MLPLRANHPGEAMPLLQSKTIVVIGAVVVDIAMYSGKEPVTAPDLARRLQLHGVP
jgi:hypothetical protein